MTLAMIYLMNSKLKGMKINLCVASSCPFLILALQITYGFFIKLFEDKKKRLDKSMRDKDLVLIRTTKVLLSAVASRHNAGRIGTMMSGHGKRRLRDLPLRGVHKLLAVSPPRRSLVEVLQYPHNLDNLLHCGK